MSQPLHEDDPNAEGVLSMDEYNATYADGPPCNSIPEDVLAAAAAEGATIPPEHGDG